MSSNHRKRRKQRGTPRYDRNGNRWYYDEKTWHRATNDPALAPFAEWAEEDSSDDTLARFESLREVDTAPGSYARAGTSWWDSVNIKSLWYRRCEHWRVPFALENGLTVFASAWTDRPSKHRLARGWADIGFYLDNAWAGSSVFVSAGADVPFVAKRECRSILFPWPDYSVPRDCETLFAGLRWLVGQVAHQRVEIGCFGGHGRTGSALAGLLVAQGIDPDVAIRRVRTEYCFEAIETTEQEALLRLLGGMV
jgi:hypothetical protein